MADIVAADDEVLAVVGLAADQQMDCGLSVFQCSAATQSSLVLRSRSVFRDKVAGENLQVDHLGRLFRADDEPEVMAVVLAALDKSFLIGGVAVGVEHAGFLAILRHALG